MALFRKNLNHKMKQAESGVGMDAAPHFHFFAALKHKGPDSGVVHTGLWWSILTLAK